MKKNFRIICSIIFIVFIAGSASADNTFISLGAGSGGSSKSQNFSIDMGIINTDSNILYGFTVGAIQNGENVPNGVLDYPVPHTFYNDLGTKQDGSEFFILGKLGAGIVNSGLFFVGILGASQSTQIHLAQSNATGWYYTQSKSTNTYGIYGAGVVYELFEKVLLEIDYDNRRGVTSMLGYVF